MSEASAVQTPLTEAGLWARPLEYRNVQLAPLFCFRLVSASAHMNGHRGCVGAFICWIVDRAQKGSQCALIYLRRLQTGRQ